MPASPLPILNRIALLLIGVIAIAVGVGWSHEEVGSGGWIFSVWCAAYTAGLGWGWWRARPRTPNVLAYLFCWLPMLAQLVVYACLWGYVAWQPPPGVLTHPAWDAPASLTTLLIAFFIVGPVAAILLARTDRNVGALFLAQTLGPLTFLILLFLS